MDFQVEPLLGDPNHEPLETSHPGVFGWQLGPVHWTQIPPTYSLHTPLDFFNSAQIHPNHEPMYPIQTVNSHMGFGSCHPSPYESCLNNAPSVNGYSNLRDSHASESASIVGYSYPSWDSGSWTASERTSNQESLAWASRDATGNDRNEYGLTQGFDPIMIQDETKVLERHDSYEAIPPRSSGQSSQIGNDDCKGPVLSHSASSLDSEPPVIDSNAHDGASLSNDRQECHVVDKCMDNFRYACYFEGCKRTFKRKEHVKRHHKAKHEQDQEGLVCEFCGKNTFNRADNLDAHRRLHARWRSTLSRGVHFVPAAVSTLQKKKRGRPLARKDETY